MPRGGQNIKPVAEKKLNGTSRPVRDANRIENFVQSTGEIPAPPEHFDKAHREKWESVCKLLKEFDMLYTLDTDALTLYVENWMISRIAWKEIQEKGATIWIETDKGSKPITNPAFRQYQDAMKIINPLQDKFGLNMRARMQIKVEPKAAKKDSAILALLQNRKKKTA